MQTVQRMGILLVQYKYNFKSLNTFLNFIRLNKIRSFSRVQFKSKSKLC